MTTLLNIPKDLIYKIMFGLDENSLKKFSVVSKETIKLKDAFLKKKLILEFNELDESAKIDRVFKYMNSVKSAYKLIPTNLNKYNFSRNNLDSDLIEYHDNNIIILRFDTSHVFNGKFPPVNLIIIPLNKFYEIYTRKKPLSENEVVIITQAMPGLGYFGYQEVEEPLSTKNVWEIREEAIKNAIETLKANLDTVEGLLIIKDICAKNPFLANLKLYSGNYKDVPAQQQLFFGINANNCHNISDEVAKNCREAALSICMMLFAEGNIQVEMKGSWNEGNGALLLKITTLWQLKENTLKYHDMFKEEFAIDFPSSSDEEDDCANEVSPKSSLTYKHR